jgi:hypothetical protein
MCKKVRLFRLIFLVSLFFNIKVNAQDFNDLVRFSNTQFQGSARFEAMGGSFGALGADISSSLVNPAGYGRFSSSHFNGGMNFSNIRNTSSFQGMDTKSSVFPVKLGSLGAVLVSDVSENNKGFLYHQFGFSYNRVENFQNEYQYKGQMFESLLDGFASQAYGASVEDLYQTMPFSSALAWDTYAIDPDNMGGYVPRLTSGDMYHNRSIVRKGGVSEYAFSYSNNYLNKLYFGVNAGFRRANFEESFSHKESLLDNPEIVSLDSFEYRYNLNTSGWGNIFKIGVIYLPFESLRLGLSLHSKTFFKFEDNWSANMTSYHNAAFEESNTVTTINDGVNPKGKYYYRLRTPAKAVGSIAYVFGTRGCINVDLEYLNYGSSRLKVAKNINDQNTFLVENAEARTILRSVVNVRVGGEIVLQSQYFLRGGFAHYPQPFSESFVGNLKGNNVYSFGGGFRWKGNSVDLGYKIQSFNTSHSAFPESIATISTNVHSLIVSYSLSF